MNNKNNFVHFYKIKCRKISNNVSSARSRFTFTIGAGRRAIANNASLRTINSKPDYFLFMVQLTSAPNLITSITGVLRISPNQAGQVVARAIVIFSEPFFFSIIRRMWRLKI